MSRAEIVARAEKIAIDDALIATHDMVKHGVLMVPSDIALKLLQEVYELRRKVEPQNADREQIVYALERARIRLQTEADAHAPGDYNSEFPAEDARRMEEAIAILTIPRHYCECPPTKCLGDSIDRCRWKLMNYMPGEAP